MTTTTALTDSLGVAFEIGDTVTVSGWGGTVRVTDTGRRAVVTGFTRAGNVKLDTLNAGGDPVANGRAVHPDCLLVARRDGKVGHEGNVR